jgi:hypothetical protein
MDMEDELELLREELTTSRLEQKVAEDLLEDLRKERRTVRSAREHLRGASFPCV